MKTIAHLNQTLLEPLKSSEAAPNRQIAKQAHGALEAVSKLRPGQAGLEMYLDLTDLSKDLKRSVLSDAFSSWPKGTKVSP